MTELLSPVCEFKAHALDSVGTFSGYCSTWDTTPDLQGDLVRPGAYSKSLGEFAATKRAPALLWNHDVREPVGKWLELTEDSRGLLGLGKLSLGVRRGAEAHQLLQDGCLSLSVGFEVRPGGAVFEQGVRILRDLKLHEVSLTALPANGNAAIIAVKSAAACKDVRELEHVLRSALLLSNRKAAALASAAWPIISGEEPDASDQDPAARKLLARLDHFNDFVRKLT